MKKIIIYSSNTCSHCTAAKEYFKEKGLEYEERNVSIDPQAKKELISKGFMGVPIILIDEVVIEGFNKNKLDEIL